MAAPTPPTVRHHYRVLRNAGWSRAEAARTAGVSYRTAVRLDEPGRCQMCGCVHPERRKGA